MKLGVMIEGQEGIGWEEWRNITRWTEDLGYESLWRSDHFFSLGGPKEKDALETFVSLVHTAENTRRIRFGPLVCSMTFRHPGITARMAAGIDQLSGGRFILGIGAGWNVAEHEAFGIELPAPKPRLDALEEGAVVIRKLFDEQPATHAGKKYQVKDAYLSPKPAQSPMPLLIGGGGEKRTLRIVAKHADEWNVMGSPLDRYRQKVAALEAHCEKVGRDPATISRSLMCSYITGATEAEVKRNVEAAAARATGPNKPNYGGGLDSLPNLIGTPEQIVEMICQLEDEGVSRIMLQHRDPPSRDQLAFVAEEILPRV